MPPPHLSDDVTLAQRLLRTPSIRAFMLKPPPLSAELDMLTTPRPHFVVTTSEVQTGALEGTIAMHYLGVPAFTDSDGLSGGLVVTSYAARTHPLHAPTVMADVRVGRYVRDNHTGDWCIITRSHRDQVTRLQYVRIRNQVIRERVCLTCDTGVFDKGDILASVLFRCHDNERRTCPCVTPCHCRFPVKQRAVKGLADAALNVMREGSASWKGKVRVTVLSQNPSNTDIDACMDVTSSFQPTMDSSLAAQMASLAIAEKVNSVTCVPRPVPSASTVTDPEPISEPREQLPQHEAQVNVANVSMNSFDDIFMQSEPEVADHFLIPSQNSLQVLDEIPMLPADPSTLPGGVEHCLDGMDLEDDWSSFINTSREGASTSSVQSSSQRGLPFEMQKAEPYLIGSVSAAQEDVEEEDDPCDGYHGCDNHTVSEQEHSTSVATKSPNFERQTSQQLRQHQEKIAQQRQPWQKQQTPLPQHTVTPQQISSQESTLQHEQVVPQSIPQQAIPLQTTAQHPVPVQPSSQPALQQAMTAAPQTYATHALPIMQTPQPWQPSFQPPNVVVKQEGLEIMTADGQDEQAELSLHGRKLAPRPAGMNVNDRLAWQMGNLHMNQYALAARLEAIEKQHKAEERRKKNRQAAARSNARKKDLMDGIRAKIRKSKAQEAELRKRESSLQEENRQLRERAGRLGLAR